MRPLSRCGVKVLAFILAYLLSVQSALAAVQSVQIRTGAIPVGNAGSVGASSRLSQLSAGSLSLTGLSLSSLSGPALSNVPAVAPSAGLAAVPVSAPAAVSTTPSRKGV